MFWRLIRIDLKGMKVIKIMSNNAVNIKDM